jgi:hypothetical protein
MDKYNIEGNIDFFAELYKSLDEDDNFNEESNLCLITYKPLTDKYVQLQCGHKFNYGPLFFDIKNHKQKFNHLEGGTTQLKINEIRCPYCRHKHEGILPYYHELGFSKINGVNIHIPGKGYTPLVLCSYLTPNPHYDLSGNEPLETQKNNVGNVKYFVCSMSGSKIVNEYDTLYQQTPLDTDKCYCYNHKKQIIKDYKKEVAAKTKEDAKKAKELVKAEEKKAKDLAKEEAKKAKEEAKKTKVKTEVKAEVKVEENTQINNGCVEILKTGANKGKLCGCKILMESLCGRHFKIKHGVSAASVEK